MVDLLSLLTICSPWWGQFLLQEFLDLVSVCFDFTIEDEERRLGSWSKSF